MNERAKRGPKAIPLSVVRNRGINGQELRAEMVERDGKEFVYITGYASIVERGYTMHDAFGEYTEVVSASAFDETLRNNPDVVLLENHKGRALARTHSDTLDLTADENGLLVRAYLNPTRLDVRDLVEAIRDGSYREMSFAFVIEEGRWSPDYTEFRIERVSLDRGDVSVVTYGANPHTSIEARATALLDQIDEIPDEHARAAYARLSQRFAEEPATEGSSLAYRRALIALEDD